MMRIARVLALGLALASVHAAAALCDGPCSITMDFANGGSISTTNGATLTFGTGGELLLGTGGSITLGTGGSLDPDVDPPDMSAGGTLVLGAGGAVQFGAGGSLDSGAAGGIVLGEASTLSVVGAASATVDSAQSVHLGDLETDGNAIVTAGGIIDGTDTTSPIHFDTTDAITVVSDADVTFSSIAGATVQLTSSDSGGDTGFVDCSEGCPPGGISTIGSPTIPTESGVLTPGQPGAGGLGLLALLPLALLGVRRRR
jgi:hypothetical protein